MKKKKPKLSATAVRLISNLDSASADLSLEAEVGTREEDRKEMETCHARAHDELCRFVLALEQRLKRTKIKKHR